MSTAAVLAIDMNKLNSFIGQFVTDLGAPVHTGMVDFVAKAGFTSDALRKHPSTLFTKLAHDLVGHGGARSDYTTLSRSLAGPFRAA